ncbi:MAG: hypothetical protein RLZZ628_3945, partial [Bacteroidota bacterium]
VLPISIPIPPFTFTKKAFKGARRDESRLYDFPIYFGHHALTVMIGDKSLNNFIQLNVRKIILIIPFKDRNP